MQYLDTSQKWQNDLCSSLGKPFNIMVIQVYALTNNAEEAEVERFYEDLQDLLEPLLQLLQQSVQDLFIECQVSYFLAPTSKA